MKLLLATGNEGKKAEIARFLDGIPVELLTLKDFPDFVPAEETEETFVGNARLKARAGFEQTGLWTLADDSGICVDALDGAPGVRSARYWGGDGSDAANNAGLLAALAGVSEQERGARFVCVLVLDTGEGEQVFEGTCTGRILEAEKGPNGFGYDPLFFDPELGKSFGEIPYEEKMARSHRGRALAAFQAWMKERLSG